MRKTVLFTAILLMVLSGVNAQNGDGYYFSRTVDGDIQLVMDELKSSLKSEGFGVITEIDMTSTLKEKLDDVEMKPYYILGVCNPGYAYKTLQVEENIGVFLPCKIVVKENENGMIDIVSINPEETMKAIGNEKLNPIAADVTSKMKKAVFSVPGKGE